MKPFFSIILPTYNRASVISNAIESIQSQDYKDWELIIIDDGSTDDTKVEVKKYCKTDERVHYIYQENKERSAARNNGINHAKGEFTCFLDSDDQFDPTHLQKLFETISSLENKNLIFVTNSRIINSENTVVTVSNIKQGETDAETVLLNIITPGQMCIPTTLIQNHLFNEKIRISEDTELLFRLIANAPLQLIPQATLIYNQHDDNSVNPLRYNAYKERKKTLNHIFKSLVGRTVKSQLKRKLLSDCHFGIAKFYAAHNNFWKVRWCMVTASLFYPETRLKEKIYLLLNPRKALQ
jgi:glycosyltransferase involved in cell wall biosynthesis